MSDRAVKFLEETQPATPCLVVDLDVVERKYLGLTQNLPLSEVFYAVKANPAPEILGRLAKLGASFDTASAGEIRSVLAHGVPGERISFGNTIKKASDIAWAHAQGVRLYAFDSEAELEKIAAHAPGAQVFCRILVEAEGALWPLNRKFGCVPDMAAALLAKAATLGLEPHGISFHVGSQQLDTNQWDRPISHAKAIFDKLAASGIELKMVDLGGGFPASYTTGTVGIEAYGQSIMEAMTKHFGNRLPRIIVEPGRYMVGDAGVLEAEVVLISQKSYSAEDRHWVYLDIGRFGGLAETEGEAIRYRIEPSRQIDGNSRPVVLAGPTCDSADILYDKAKYEMPVNLKIGDRVRIFSTGAYTTTYSAVNFNGFEPLKAYYI
ncbi:type III PLP-dependent enzyme [Dongia soli]|uniref:ornithine decarboxylase n=1 Tax=Dongia soli TaxID=600628 RepID=A0ABU5ECC2_9PROT|nr:type III PLP-dependent enzyme [Dongia soli]MDY0883521.1 type III PLP-dependent enzyme [Dongia soli]